MIYLDASATTPPHKLVIDEISSIQKSIWGNPSSIHKIGIQASENIENSRIKISNKLSCMAEEIVFTSGATESIHLALLGTAKSFPPSRIVISSVEHPAVNHATKLLREIGWKVTIWPVDSKGTVNLNKLDEILCSDTKIVSIIWGQSEIGTVQPIKLISEECKKRNIIFHTDATQILPNGLFNWKDLDIDLLSASGHKLLGPKGIGILLCKQEKLDLLKPLQGGGFQENFKRGGTQPVELIAGLSKAIELIENKIKVMGQFTIFESTNVFELTNSLKAGLSRSNQLFLTGHPNNRLPNHLSFIVETINKSPIAGSKLIREFSRRGLFASTGTACQSNNENKKLVLNSIGIPMNYHNSSIRLSLGPWLNELQIQNAEDIIMNTLSNFN